MRNTEIKTSREREGGIFFFDGRPQAPSIFFHLAAKTCQDKMRKNMFYTTRCCSMTFSNNFPRTDAENMGQKSIAPSFCLVIFTQLMFSQTLPVTRRTSCITHSRAETCLIDATRPSDVNLSDHESVVFGLFCFCCWLLNV